MKEKTEGLGAKAARSATVMPRLWGFLFIVFSIMVAGVVTVAIDVNFLGIDLSGLTPRWRPMLHYFFQMLAGAVILKITEKIFP